MKLGVGVSEKDGCGKCGMESVEWKVWNGKCGMESVEWKVWNGMELAVVIAQKDR